MPFSFADCAFDCVYADNSLERAYDITRTFAEIRRVLTPGGLLVTAISADAIDPDHICDNHTWKTTTHDVRARLEHAGFIAIKIDEVDIYREPRRRAISALGRHAALRAGVAATDCGLASAASG